ncbi:MAG TPA: aspartate kinase, partial [Nitrososphaera sp.]|nr:aspartate kinase [Nitrososphaera sp.]
MRLVMKFGGTAVDSPDKVRHIAQLVQSHKKGNEVVCVVSAVRGMTDGLLSITDSVRRGDKTSLDDFVKRCADIHMQIVQGAISDKELKNEALATVKNIINE